MPLKIELNNQEQNITWEDLEYGDVFETDSGIAMKVFNLNRNDKKVDYILFLDDFGLYSDVEKYKINKIIKCKLIEE